MNKRTMKNNNISDLYQSEFNYFLEINNSNIQDALNLLKKDRIEKAVDVIFSGWDQFYNSDLSGAFYGLITTVVEFSILKFGKNKYGNPNRWEGFEKAQQWACVAKHPFLKWFRLLLASRTNLKKSGFYWDKCFTLKPPFYEFYGAYFIFWASQKNKKSEKAFKKMLEFSEPAFRDFSYFLYVLFILEIDKISKIIYKYKQIIIKEPKNINAYRNLGIAYGWISDFEKAHKYLDVYINNKKEPGPYVGSCYSYICGMVSFNEGKYKESEKWFSKTAKLIQEITHYLPGNVAYLPGLLKGITKWFNFDRFFKEIFLKDSMLEIKVLVERLHKFAIQNYKRSFAKFIPALSAKSYCTEALEEALLLDQSSVTTLHKASKFLEGRRYFEIQKEVDYIEDFIITLFSYNKKIDELSAVEEKELLSILRKASNFPDDTTHLSLKNSFDELKKLYMLNTGQIIKELRSRKKLELTSNLEPQKELEERKVEYEDNIDLKDENYQYKLLGLEIDYVNNEPIVYFNIFSRNKKPKVHKLISEFSKSEKSFALLTRLAVAVKAGIKRQQAQLGYNGWLHINDKEGSYKKWCLYIKYQGVDEFREFLCKCDIFDLNKDEKRQLIRTKREFSEVRLAIPAENIEINIRNLKSFASRFVGVKGEDYSKGVQRIQNLIRDSLDCYSQFC